MDDEDMVIIAAVAAAAAYVIGESDHEEEMEQIRQEKAHVDLKRKQAERVHREALATRDHAVARLTSGTLDAAIRAIQELQAEIQTPEAYQLDCDRVLKERDDLLQRAEQLEVALRDKNREIDDMTIEYEQRLGVVRSVVGSAQRRMNDPSPGAPRQAKRLRPAPASTNAVPISQIGRTSVAVNDF
ncbi:hypothetical protein SDRG_15626 [Saprolegnia diclina VS20]|uniref:Uncharacterized protein n=1 Tax=Saprolegnia diclina (strain VS20) TaxID=1156394 RepID=T0PMD0_SAPDV|nr:hypothetical protein SDRG_15626 [Saprolegnia diclina VS20]EQC26534.1 hypothetical protein SDRG_15626 [Saprolegnia diclina VS20]|eukprot:XP_008620027.1 hypothetical protein SDRG_15626 [Saprolegnia diclina VS20]